MSKKLYFLISFVLVLSLAGNVLGYDVMTWDNNSDSGDRLWHTGTNWKVFKKGTIVRHGAPVATEWACIDRYQEPNGPIINADTNAVGEWIDLGGVQGPYYEAVLTMTGGRLTAGTWFDMGGYYAGIYRFDISGGTITAPYIYVGYVTDSYATMNISDGNIITETEFMIGVEDTSYGEVNMTGGDVNLGGWLEIGSSWAGYLGKGNLDLHGGTITTILLSMGGGGVGTMDFAYDGTLIIDGDYRIPNDWLFDPCSDTPLEWDDSTGAINPPVDWDGYTGTIAILTKRGLITAYGTKVGEIITDSNYSVVGKRAAVNLDYGVANPGQTTITAGADDPNLAYDPDPLFGAGGLSATDINLLSWAAGTDTNGYDVYFGTSFAEVNEASDPNTLPGRGRQALADVNYPISVTWGTTYFWRIDEVNASGVPEWKGIVWNFATERAWAKNPRPDVNATGVSVASAILSWDPGPVVASVNGHYVYLSTDFNDVNDRDPNVLTVRGLNNYTPGLLEFSKRYYWAVDEVNLGDDPNIWPGEVWYFTTANYLAVDNFNSYATHDAIKAVWKDWSNSDSRADIYIEKGTTFVRDGNSMKFNYENFKQGQEERGYSESEADASALASGTGTDWTYGGIEALVLHFRGKAGNSAQPLYLVLSDDTNEGMVTYDDANGTQEEFWHTWYIDLQDPCGPLADVDMNNVAKVYLGVGIRGTMDTGGGEGDVYFDDIDLHPPFCRSNLVETDFTGDCITDYNDVDIMARDWLMYDYNVPAVPISGDPCGWWKLDDGNPSTTAVDSSAYGNDGTIFNKDWVDGHPNDPGKALHFDGDGLATYDRVECAVREGNTPGIYPAELMPATFTVACWVKVANFEYYDGLVVNGDDYGETGQHSSGFYLYAADSTGVKDFGLGIRTEDDMYYVVTPDIYKTDTWYHLAGTYNDANKASVYVDGKLAAGPTDVGGPIRWLNYEDDFPKYFLIGALHASDVTDWYRAEATIDDVRVYGYALPYGEIVTLAEQGPVLYHDVISPANIYDLEAKTSKIVNFRDYVILADHWLEGPILWPPQ